MVLTFQPVPAAGPEQPGQQDHRDQDDDQHRRLLVAEQAAGHGQPEEQRLRPAGAAAQPDGGFQRDRQEQHTGRDVQLEPGMPGDLRGQPEERPGRDRAELAGQPEPGRTVHGVAGQPGHQHGQQVVRGAGAEQHSHREHDHAFQRHQRVVAELSAHRRRDQPGVPRVAQVLDLVRDPPEVPDIHAAVPRGLHLPVEQVGDARPGHGQAGDQVAEQQQELPGQRAGGQLCPGQPQAAASGRAGTGSGSRVSGRADVISSGSSAVRNRGFPVATGICGHAHVPLPCSLLAHGLAHFRR